jgi:hypothetical protein
MYLQLEQSTSIQMHIRMKACGPLYLSRDSPLRQEVDGPLRGFRHGMYPQMRRPIWWIRLVFGEYCRLSGIIAAFIRSGIYLF